MSETRVVMKSVVMGSPHHHLVFPQDVWAHEVVGMEPITEPIPLEQAQALIKLLGE
jgi:hypothetical protein